MGKVNLIKNIVSNKVVNCAEIKPSAKQVPGTVKVMEPQDSFNRACECVAHFDDSKTTVFGEFPKDYVDVEEFMVDAEPEHYSRLLKKLIPAKPAHMMTSQTLKPSYYISHLFSHGKGQGTEAVKSVVTKSLNDTRTQGRVTIQSDIIDGKTSPSGFYYKLGFRFANKDYNRIMQEWLEQGGKKENAPLLTGLMYLPIENIHHCLNY